MWFLGKDKDPSPHRVRIRADDFARRPAYTSGAAVVVTFVRAKNESFYFLKTSPGRGRETQSPRKTSETVVQIVRGLSRRKNCLTRESQERKVVESGTKSSKAGRTSVDYSAIAQKRLTRRRRRRRRGQRYSYGGIRRRLKGVFRIIRVVRLRSESFDYDFSLPSPYPSPSPAKSRPRTSCCYGRQSLRRVRPGLGRRAGARELPISRYTTCNNNIKSPTSGD